MIRWLFLCIGFFFLFSFEVGFIHSLSFPFDRIPLLLVITVYGFHGLNFPSTFWWLVFEGMSLDRLSISFVPLETVSYAIAGLVMILCSRHLFSHRSYYGVASTLIIILTALCLIEIVFAGFQEFFGTFPLALIDIVAIRLWGAGFGLIMLFLLFPFKKFLQSQ